MSISCQKLEGNGPKSLTSMLIPQLHTAVQMAVVSPNVDFDKSSTSCTAAEEKQGLGELRDALNIKDDSHVEEVVRDGDEHLSEWESDEEILQPEDEGVPNGPNPVVPPILREPEAPAHQ